jgi:hypothetical protein
MNVSQDDLSMRYKQLSNNELLNMYLSRSQYTTEAVQAMVEEINSRGLNQDDLEGFLQHRVLEKDEIFQRENFRELIFLEKAIFYYLSFLVFLFLFFFAWLADESKRQGYRLKIKQALTFFISSMILLFVADWIYPQYVLHIWAIGFVIPLLIDYRASKNRHQSYERIYGKPKINQEKL